jgi:hypothetical protein
MPSHPSFIRRAAAVSAWLPLLAACASAQTPEPPVPPSTPDAPAPPRPPRAARAGRGLTIFPGGWRSAGSFLGITPRSGSGPADTLGLLVAEVDDDTPADKAGITPGTRLVSADGIDLRLDAADLDDPAAEALPENRLRRLLGRKEPGDTITLVMLQNGKRVTARVALAEPDLTRMMRSVSTARGRRVLGVSFAERGSMRDTAGLLITGITAGGAADKAGIAEGDRLVSIDGIDLRVPAADAGTPEGAQARVARLRRTLNAVKDSAPVRLEVLTDGRRRTISVTPTREPGLNININGFEGIADEIRNGVRRGMTFQWDGEAMRAEGDAMRVQGEALRRATQEQRRAIAEGRREIARAQRDMARGEFSGERDVEIITDISSDADESERGNRRTVRGNTIRGRTDGATLVLDGLSLAVVDRDFSAQFGAGAQEGALVVRIRGDWEPLRVGDVLLSVGTRRVRDGKWLDVAFDRSRDQTVEVIRNGRLDVLTLKARR